MDVWFLSLLAPLSFVAGATASIVGFGIGSLLTPVFALRFGADTAVMVVAVPHLAGGLLRGWHLRRAIDWSIVVRFGLLSAAGGLAGAFVFSRLAPYVLTRVIGALLVMTAIAGLTGWARRWTPRGPLVWVLGTLSGFFGGVAGNQGGLRAAALSAFDLAPSVFVATSTIVGVMIDVVRVPVYGARAWMSIADLWLPGVVAVAGVVFGTLAGNRILLGLSQERFRMLVSTAVGLLGLWFLFGPV